MRFVWGGENNVYHIKRILSIIPCLMHGIGGAKRVGTFPKVDFEHTKETTLQYFPHNFEPTKNLSFTTLHNSL